jgi:aminopeptidase N
MLDRYTFISPALAPEENARKEFFDSLEDPVNRENEPWVLTALGYLHHPLRQQTSLKYIRPSLDMLAEIQVTGDIFFPGRWLDVTLGGHQSAEALNIAEDFMETAAAYELDPKLRLKVWVAMDMLERSVRMRENELLIPDR